MLKPRIYLSPPHMGGDEQRFVTDAFDSNFVAPVGPQLTAFEQEFSEYSGIPHCVALSSGTAAIHLALKGLGVQAGDRVIASSLTFIGSVSPIMFLGAEPVLIDSDEHTWNLDPDLLAEELEKSATQAKLPKAVIPTDLYGQCADLDRIQATCKPYNIPVVSDSAEAMGAKYKGHHAGAGATASAYSFNGNKIITTSGGGMLASSNKDLIDYARFLSTQARDPAPHYQHSEIGFNYRMSNLLAGVGRGQLKVLNERVDRRREIFVRYQTLLGDLDGITFMPEAETGRCNRWLTVIQVDPDRFGATPDEIRITLEKANIESRPVWKPMHLQPAFVGCAIRGGAVSERLFKNGLCLPSGSSMSDHDIERVAGLIKELAS